MATTEDNNATMIAPLAKSRWAWFRICALILVLLPLVLLEVMLRTFVAAPSPASEDPYISFARISPLFVLDATGTRYETAEERLQFFRRQSFSAVKRQDSFRVFVLGGSTVQGRPWSVQTSFGTWLQLALRAAAPDTEWELINCGGISYASYRLVPIMRELLDYQPDLFVIYTGHNEFLEDRTYGRLKRTPKALIRLHQLLLNLRSYQLADQFVLSRRTERTSRSTLPAEVQARLDFRDGLASYHRDDAWRAGVIEHFRHNLETMLQTAGRARIPVILMKPAANIKDCSPFKSEYDGKLTQAEQLWAKALLEEAGQVSWSQIQEKLRLLEAAAKIDSRHARICYLTGKCYDHMGRTAEARQWFERAKEEDVCPLRILDPMADAITATAKRHGTGYVDVQRLIEERTDDGIAGDVWLVDHVHPTIGTHRLIAGALLEAMQEMGLIATIEGWQARRDELWADHLAALDEAYFERGAQRLKRLAEWSRGRIPEKHP